MRKLQIKFPSQIRISGWDFGSSARAMNQAGGKDGLMTYEPVSFAQADLVKVTRSTTERKSMSTKTSIKRIALVAVAALGLGMVSTVTANAAANDNTNNPQIAATLTNTSTTFAGRVGQQVSFDITGSTAAGSAVAARYNVVSVAAAITSQPASSSVYPSLYCGGTSIETGTNDLDNCDPGLLLSSTAAAITTGSTGSSTAVATINWHTDVNEAIDANTGATLATVKFTPTVAGTYTVVVWNEKDRTYTAETAGGVVPTAQTQASLSGSESYKTFTINVAASVASVALTAIGGSSTTATYTAGSSGLNGALIKVSLKDASGNAAALAPGETVTLTPTGTGDIDRVNGVAKTSTAGAAYNLSSADFNSSGVAFVNMIDATAESVTLTASINGSASTSTTITYKAVVAVTAVSTPSTSGFGGTAPDYTVAIGANTFTWKATASTGSYVGFAVYEGLVNGSTIGAITGYTTRLAYDVAAGGDTTDGYAAVSVTATTYADSEVAYEIAADANAAYNSASGTEGQLQAVTKTSGVLSASPTAVNAVTGSTNTLTVTLKDIFGVAYPSQTVTASVSGKNPTTTSLTAVTDANGKASFSFTDANTNTAVSDIVTFTAGSTASVTISYGTNAVDTLTATYTGSTDVVAGTTYTNIDEAYTGATGTYATMTVTAKNAAGATLAGVPVTFTVAGLTGAEVHTTYATVYTGTDGKATTRVSSYAAGKATITATAGAKTATGDVYFAQGDATAARTISAVATTGGVTATVKDRYGNPVAGAYVWATRSGSAYFGNGVSSTNGVTDVNGTVDFVVNGSGTVTLQLGSSSAASATYGQSYAAAGYDVDATNGTAVTAYVAGTSTTAQKGLGGSLAPAGVNKVTVDVTGNSTASDSIDAANEATDAANAATDAANAAAEAADAATAAAQDAQAAVAALATEVAAMISGIKAQIIRLTNLVVKIQKKVKA